MSSLRDHYRNKVYLILLPIVLAIFVVLFYFLLVNKYYKEQTNYFENNRDSLYSEYKERATKEILEQNLEELNKPKNEQKYWYLDKKKLKENFEDEFVKRRDRIPIIYFGIGFMLVALTFIGTYKYINGRPIYCPHCLKTVLKSEIVPFLCPFCNKKNIHFSSIYGECEEPDCKSIIPSVPCPHCSEQIDLLNEYDFNKIKIKRYGKKTKI